MTNDLQHNVFYYIFCDIHFTLKSERVIEAWSECSEQFVQSSPLWIYL